MPTVPQPRFYVYILARPNGKPFYVGKGKRSRIYAHENEAKTNCRCHKCQVIRKIWRNGGEVQRYKVLTTSDETEAYAYEAQLIALMGRESLTNLRDGGPDGGNFTDQALLDIGAAARARWGDPSYRAARLEEIRSRWNDPGYRAKIQAAWDNPDRRKHVSTAIKAKWEDPDFRARVIAKNRATKSTAEYHEKASAAHKKRWQNPEQLANIRAKTAARWQEPGYRERISAKVKEAHARRRIESPASPEDRARMSEAARQRMENPETRTKVSTKAKQRMEDPAARARISEQIKALWKDPEYRARMLASRKAKKEGGDD